MNTPSNEITIIIILYEENEQLVLQCLKNIKNFKIIIVDNANNKVLKRQVEKNYKIFKYILNEKNYGYSKAANQAIKLSNTEFILMFQADGIIDQKDIFKLLNAYKKYENSFIVSPTLYDKDQNLCANSGNFPEKYLYKTPMIIDGDICAETVLGSIIMFKREDMIEIGLYDENLFLYFLDDELCKRIRDKKKAVIQVLNARAIHEHGQIKVRNPVKRTFLRHFYLTFDELYYFYKIKKHRRLLDELSNKVPKYFLKLLLNLIILRPNKAAYFLSKIMAFYKFKKFSKKKEFNTPK
tara:strand:- start:653 stop:1540 length:888 start_codon:yes stop_codon:yes gene_type:complete